MQECKGFKKWLSIGEVHKSLPGLPYLDFILFYSMCTLTTLTSGNSSFILMASSSSILLPSFISMDSSTLILTFSIPSTSHVTQVSLQEPVSPSTQHMQFCNNTTQFMVALSHYMKQHTSTLSISHCTELTAAVCLGFIYKQFKNTTNKQPPWRTILPHDYGCYNSQENPCPLENLQDDDNYKRLHIKMWTQYSLYQCTNNIEWYLCPACCETILWPRSCRSGKEWNCWRLVRSGSGQRFIGPEPCFRLSKQNIRKKMKRWMRNQHLALWRGPCKCTEAGSGVDLWPWSGHSGLTTVL